jgi:hypothetical protein
MGRGVDVRIGDLVAPGIGSRGGFWGARNEFIWPDFQVHFAL